MPTAVRSRHPVRGVRPHRAGTSRTSPRRVRPARPGLRSAQPSSSPTRNTRHASTPAGRSRPSPPGSPIPPPSRYRSRGPALPTPNSSVSNWRCCWTAPRPAAESSTPTPGPRRRRPPRQRSPHASGTSPCRRAAQHGADVLERCTRPEERARTVQHRLPRVGRRCSAPAPTRHTSGLACPGADGVREAGFLGHLITAGIHGRSGPPW